MLTTEQITYSVFGLVLVAALALDLGLLSKKNTTITIRKALLDRKSTRLNSSHT